MQQIWMQKRMKWKSRIQSVSILSPKQLGGDWWSELRFQIPCVISEAGNLALRSSTAPQYMTLGQLLNLSEPQLSYLLDGNNSIHLASFLYKLNKNMVPGTQEQNSQKQTKHILKVHFFLFSKKIKIQCLPSRSSKENSRHQIMQPLYTGKQFPHGLINFNQRPLSVSKVDCSQI